MCVSWEMPDISAFDAVETAASCASLAARRSAAHFHCQGKMERGPRDGRGRRYRRQRCDAGPAPDVALPHLDRAHKRHGDNPFWESKELYCDSFYCIWGASSPLSALWRFKY
ncbi:hypothetical protein B0H17DRAFT_1102173 [Mycena rosella]|uniref:Uncharacterized protein n=1 Tax=Mycena rosella TaxID=1033263 RepID=A0AAD7CHV5_MYCRO|nr:hypothetical protein B0H17DRAFT_1102173 [Mycena rosella]